MTKLRVLFLAANPPNTIWIRVDEEVRAIRLRLCQSHGDRIDLVDRGAIRPADLLPELNAHRPHIVHFSGHGTAAGILLQGDDAGSLQLESSQLEELFRTLRDQVRIVVLNACYSAEQAEAIRKHIDFVVGMDGFLDDKVAAVFSEAFYGALAAGLSLRDAFDQGKLAITLGGLSGGAPRLFESFDAATFFPLRAAESVVGIDEVLGPLRVLQRRFFRSIEPDLAGGRLIQRKETSEILDAIGKGSRVLVVHGIAGVGKTGIICELARELEKREVPFLPLRLGHFDLATSPQITGIQQLGLPDSPARCLAALAGESDAVLLLDQIDALRWTNAHSSTAWDVCCELIKEALEFSGRIQIIVCCRTFDLEHDPQLRSWEKGIQHLRRIAVEGLTDNDVETAIELAADGRSVRSLRPTEKALLRHVLHLQMWLEILMTCPRAPQFDTASALMDAFWANRFDKMQEKGMPRERAVRILNKLIEALADGASLSAPLRALEAAEGERRLLQSLHLLRIEDRQVSFCHQSYLDYLVVQRLLADLGSHTVVDWLGAREHQSLFRREQLRLVLTSLRDAGGEKYVSNLTSLLEQGDKVRFHLRLLGLQFVCQVTQPTPGEKQLLIELLHQPFWRDHVLTEASRSNAVWFDILADTGIVGGWLASQEVAVRDMALHLMKRIAPKSGERVAKLLQPFAALGGEWARRIAWVLPYSVEEDSDELFKLRLSLNQKDLDESQCIYWKQLALLFPERASLLASKVLTAFVKQVSEIGSEYTVSEEKRARYELEEIEESKLDHGVLARGWADLAGVVDNLTQVHADGDSVIVFSDLIMPEPLGTVTRLLRRFGAELLNRDWRGFVSLGEQAGEGSRAGDLLLLDSLVEGPEVSELADWALEWLMAAPGRVRLRFSLSSDRWRLAGRLVEKYSPVCSEECYARLDRYILDYREPDLFERYMRHSDISRKYPEYKRPPSLAGAMPYHLLPCLPQDRRSQEADRRIRELERKFSDVDAIEFSGLETSSVSGLPDLPRKPDKLTDRQWLDIINDDRNLDRKRVDLAILPFGSRWWTVATLAGGLREIARKEPQRFARLALSIRPEAPDDYLEAIVSSLRGSSPPAQLPPVERERWQPASHEAIENVFQFLRERQPTKLTVSSRLAKEVCWILQEHPGHAWTAGSVGMLIRIASEHEDPTPEDWNRKPTQGSAHSLLSQALNTARGSAGFALQSLLFKHPERFPELRSAIATLVQDPHPAARIGAIEACLAVLRIDRQQAIRWFLSACQGPELMLATQPVERFLRYTLHQETEELRFLVCRMLCSEDADVAQVAARRIAASFLVSGTLSELYQECLQGKPATRRGIAEVAAELLGAEPYASKATEALLCLANDDDSEVIEVVARSFRQLNLKLVQAEPSAWASFALSKAFRSHPSHLLSALKDQSGSLLPFSECILLVGESFYQESANGSPRLTTAPYERELIPLLLRLYEQSREVAKVHQSCLNLWDNLLERRVLGAMELARELDGISSQGFN